MKMSFLKDLRPATSMVVKSLTISDLKLYRWSRVTVRFRPNRLTVAEEPCQQLSTTVSDRETFCYFTLWRISCNKNGKIQVCFG